MSLWRDLNSPTRNLLKIASQYIATEDSYHNSLNFCCDELNIPSWDGNICKTAAAAIVNKSHSVLFRISSGKWFGGRATLCLHKFLPKEELGRKFWSSSQFQKPWKWKWRYCQIKDRNKRQITGLITTRRIATKILEFIAITQKLWKRKWKWRYCQKKMGTRNKSQHRTDHHEKNYKTNSGLYCRSVSRNYLQSESNWDCSLYSTTFVVEQTSFFLRLLVCFLWFIFLNTKLCYKNTGTEDWKPCYLPGCGQ